jgi:hypothetical protein
MRRRGLGSYDVESVARRASDARHEEFERRWTEEVAEALSVVVRRTEDARSAIRQLHGALSRLEHTQVEATDEDITRLVTEGHRLLKRYHDFTSAMEYLGDRAERLEDSFK